MLRTRVDHSVASKPRSAAGLDKLVLATVNAPFKRAITPEILTACLSDPPATSDPPGTWGVHLNTFFNDVRPELVLSFAKAHGIALPVLRTAYRASTAFSGERNPGLEAALVPVETSP